jgi:hypothetical protein
MQAVKHSWYAVWLAAIAIIAAACTAVDPADRDPATGNTRETLSEIPVGDPSLSDIPGRLLVLGLDDEITTMRPDGTDRVTLAPSDPKIEERTQPTWSPQGDRVAWTERWEDGKSYLVVADHEGNLSSSPSPAMASYIAWGPDGHSIAITGDDLEGNLFLAVAEPGEPATVIDRGAPLYFDWSPDGQNLLVHIEDRFEYVSLDGADRVPVFADGAFRVGVHVRDSIVFGLARDVGESLAIGGPEGSDTTELLRYTAPMAYVLDPGEDRLAVMVKGSPESQELSDVTDSELPILGPRRLVVVDAATGDIEEVAAALGVAWWWSPDGDRLLYSTQELIDGIQRLQWHVWDGAESTSFTPFSPTGAFGRGYLAFFDQLARSVDLWAPDGSAFVYAGGSGIEDAGIWVQPLHGGGPVRVSHGQVAIWSPNA